MARFNVALLRVSRRISQEALEALCTVNTVVVRQYTEGEYRYAHLDKIRHVILRLDLTNYNDQGIDSSFCKAVRGIAAAHPSLQTMVMSSGALPYQQTTVREFIDQNPFCRTLRCIDIGVFEAEPVAGIRCKFVFENESLRDALPVSKALLSNGLVDVADEWSALWKPFAKPTSKQKTREYMLAMWLGAYEIIRDAIHRPDALEHRDVMELAAAEWHVHEYHYFDTPDMPFTNRFLPDDVKLVDVNKDDHSQELLAWASEYIGLGATQWERMLQFQRGSPA